MKSVILLSVAMVLFNSGTLPANAAAYRQHKNHHSNLEAIISMAEQYTHNLTEVRADQTATTETLG